MWEPRLRKQPNQAKVTAASTAARSRNKDTVDAILSAAIRILALEGYTRFTLRHIAKRVGLRLAAVQHYYPTKKEMLRAAIRGSIRQWDEPVSRLMLLPRRGANPRLQAVIKLHLRKSSTPSNPSRAIVHYPSTPTPKRSTIWSSPR